MAYNDDTWMQILKRVGLSNEDYIKARLLLARESAAFRQGMLGDDDDESNRLVILEALKPQGLAAAGGGGGLRAGAVARRRFYWIDERNTVKDAGSDVGMIIKPEFVKEFFTAPSFSDISVVMNFWFPPEAVYINGASIVSPTDAYAPLEIPDDVGTAADNPMRLRTLGPFDAVGDGLDGLINALFGGGPVASAKHV